MKYSAALLLALLGFTAAAVLPKQTAVSRSFNHQRNYNPHDRQYNNNDNNNNNNYNNNPYNNDNNQKGNEHFLEKQQAVLQFFYNIEQDNYNPYVANWARNFNPYQSIARFNNQRAVENFLRNYQNKNFLPRDEPFSPTSQEHQNQAAQLFNFFYSAQDWNTFKQAAAWARQRFNPKLFAYAFTAAVFNHPSTRGVVIPAFYEVFPHDFIPSTALQQVYSAKLRGERFATVYANYTNQNQNNKYFINYYHYRNSDNNNNNYGPHNAHAVFAENDGSQQNNAGVQENQENRVSYFTEDVGLNLFHSYYHIAYPPFFGSNNNNNYYDNIFSGNNNDNQNNNFNKYYTKEAVKRGENFYFFHQQLYARYVLERLSNNLPIPHPINFQDRIETGYNANLQHFNGQGFPARPPNTYFQQQQKENSNNYNNAHYPNNNQAETPDVYEQRLQEAAESGYVINQDGSQTKLNSRNGLGVLANLAAAPANSPNPAYYGDYFSTAKNAIGNIVDPNNQNGVAPGVVANYNTAARDPAYYQFLAKLNQIFRNFQNNQGPYSQNELSFSGVKIQSFDVSDLITYFESFYVNVNNAVNSYSSNNNNNQNNDNENNYNYPNDNNNYNNDNSYYPNNNNNENNNNYPNNNNHNQNNENNNYVNNNDDNYNHNNNNNNNDNSYYPNNNNNNNNENNNNYPNNNNYKQNNENNNDVNNNYDNYNHNNNNNNNDNSYYPYNNDNVNNNNNNYNPNNNNNNNNYTPNNNNSPNNNNYYPNNNRNNNTYYPNNDNDNNNENYPNNNYNNANYNVKFQRLTHKPFNYKLNVHSDKSANAVVRVFIGPKFDSNGQQFTLPQASQYFVQLDQFRFNLHNGQNVIERNSQQSPIYYRDVPSFQQLWNRVHQAKQGQQNFFTREGRFDQLGFPLRTQLPKGKESGQEFVFYAIITEANENNDNLNSNYGNDNNDHYHNNNNNNNKNYNNYEDNHNNNHDNDNNSYNQNENYDNSNYNNNYSNYVQDNKSVGYPFDRPVQDANYNTPNQYFKTVTIYHKSQNNN